MARILVISPTPTHPQDAGNRARIYSLLYNIQKAGHEVHFAYIQTEKGGEEDAIARAWDAYFPIPYKGVPRPLYRKIHNRLKKYLPDSFEYIPYRIDEWYYYEFNAFFKGLHEKFEYDAVMVEYIWFSQAFTVFGENVVKLIDTHDVFADRHKLYLKNGQKPVWFYTNKHGERKALRRADVVIGIQRHEADYFRNLSGKETITVGHLSTVITKERKTPENKTLLFVGSWHSINVEAMDWFIDKIFPAVQARIPDVVLQLVGNCAEKIKRVDNAGIQYIGKQEDLAPWYEQAAIVVNPVKFGTGLKIKSIEALAAGCPMVTTAAGAAGLEDGKDTAFLMAEEADEFITQICRILEQPDLAEQLSKDGGAYAEHYNEIMLKPLLEAITKKQ